MIKDTDIITEMPLSKARVIAEGICEFLGKYCDRIEIAGSIRRKNPTIHDIEIVCIPKKEKVQKDLFAESFDEIPTAEFCNAVMRMSARINKGNLMQRDKLKYTQVLVPITGERTQFFKVDIFLCSALNWGYIFTIRTGSADFSHLVLAKKWCKMGFHGRDGMLYNIHGEAQILREEQELFDLIKLPYTKPEDRNA